MRELNKEMEGEREREKKIDVFIRHTFKKTIFLILIRMTISININRQTNEHCQM